MLYYLLLASATAIIAVLTVLVWNKTRNLCFPFGFACLYFWSLYGAWTIVDDNLTGEYGRKHHYLYDALFPIELNDSYAWSLILYALFTITVQVVVLLYVNRCSIGTNEIIKPITVSHPLIILISAVSGILAYLIIRDSLATAIQLNVSPYVLSRTEHVPFFTLYTLLNRAALVPPAIGLAIYASGSRSRMLIGRTDRTILFGYGVVIGGMVIASILFGNKSELLMASVAGYLFYLVNDLRPRWIALHCGMVVVAMGFVFIDVARAVPIVDMLTDFSWMRSDDFLKAAKSNEAFGSHFSMYGAVYYRIPVTYGTSFISLAASAIPRYFWEDRPPPIYVHYAEYLGFARVKVDGQGYSVHHATGWYLNFGTIGVMLGGILFARIWCFLYNRHLTLSPSHSRWREIFFCIAPWTFTASIPSLLRAGPEAYKGIVLEAFLIPWLVFVLARKSGRSAAGWKNPPQAAHRLAGISRTVIPTASR